jgi:aminoglycoside 2'-N-acetyltransferase I
MPASFEVVASEHLPSATLREVIALCTEAYGEEFSSYLRDIGPGVHVLGRVDGELVTHAMWVTRWLQPGGRPALRTAYVEAVATRPSHQGRGLASAALRRIAGEIEDHDLGALAPSDPAFYARLGWQSWRGPLFIRTKDGQQATPDECVMILRLPRTPAELDLDGSLSAEWRRGELW